LKGRSHADLARRGTCSFCRIQHQNHFLVADRIFLFEDNFFVIELRQWAVVFPGGARLSCQSQDQAHRIASYAVISERQLIGGTIARDDKRREYRLVKPSA
jgi:hypothetical protein